MVGYVDAVVSPGSSRKAPLVVLRIGRQCPGYLHGPAIAEGQGVGEVDDGYE